MLTDCIVEVAGELSLEFGEELENYIALGPPSEVEQLVKRFKSTIVEFPASFQGEKWKEPFSVFVRAVGSNIEIPYDLKEDVVRRAFCFMRKRLVQ